MVGGIKGALDWNEMQEWGGVIREHENMPNGSVILGIHLERDAYSVVIDWQV